VATWMRGSSRSLRERGREGRKEQDGISTREMRRAVGRGKGAREGAYVLESTFLFEQGIDRLEAPGDLNVEVPTEGGGEGVLEEVGELAVFTPHFFGVHYLVAAGYFETML